MAGEPVIGDAIREIGEMLALDGDHDRAVAGPTALECTVAEFKPGARDRD